jgi:hypothetical protein
MIVGKAIYHLLTNATAITDIVGTRIYPEVAQQDGDLPYIVYNITNNEPSDTKPEPSKLDTAGVEVNCYATSYSQAIDIAVAVRGALDRVKGTYNGVNVQSIQYINEVIDFDEPQRAYNISADYEVRISRTDFEIAQGSPVTGTQLGQLSDVNVSSLAEGQILKYDVSESEWVNASLPILTTGGLTTSEVGGFFIIGLSSNPSFDSITSNGDLTVSGDILLAGGTTKLIRPLDVAQAAGPLTIQSNGDLVIELDQDDNEPYKAFIVKNGGDAEVFKVDEEGNVTVNQEYVLPSSDGGTDYFLKTDGSGQLYFATLYGTSGNTGASPPPAVDTLVELLDTDISNLQDNQIIRYDSASGKWLNEDFQALPAGGTTGQALVKASGTDYDVQWADIAIDVQYHQRYDTEAAALRSGATETVELYYTAQADGDGLSESASSDTPSAGNVIRRKLWYAEKAQADPDTYADWTQFTAIADDTTYANAKAALLAYLKERTGGTVPISLKMTWEEVAEATLLLDTYTGASAAYSLRKLRTAYTGDAINVWNGTSYADIGFDGSGELDTTALAAHCGSNDGFVSVWYDQSGNSNDATQTVTSSMPKIYDGTTQALVTENGKPAMSFDSTDDKMTSSFASASNYSVFHVFAQTQIAASGNLFSLIDYGTSGSKSGLQVRNSKYSVRPEFIDFDTQDLNQNLIEITHNNGQFDAYKNATNIRSASVTLIAADGVTINNLIGSTRYVGAKWQELIFYPTEQSGNRTDIEDNINTFYSIY